MQTPSPLARQKGASFFETLVATVLGLLVLVLSTRSVLAVVVGESRPGAARPLVESIEFARAEAAQRRSPVSICGLDARDVNAASGLVHCAAPDGAWLAGWIVFGDSNLDGQLDDGEAVLRVVREVHPAVFPENVPGAITFRPIGTLASATPRRLLFGGAAGAVPTHAVCVGIDGYTQVLPLERVCR